MIGFDCGPGMINSLSVSLFGISSPENLVANGWSELYHRSCSTSSLSSFYDFIVPSYCLTRSIVM